MAVPTEAHAVLQILVLALPASAIHAFHNLTNQSRYLTSPAAIFCTELPVPDTEGDVYCLRPGPSNRRQSKCGAIMPLRGHLCVSAFEVP